MCVSGSYLAGSIKGRILRPILILEICMFRDVLPVFENLNEKAEQIAGEHFIEIGNQPAGEYESIDMASVAEDAFEEGEAYCETMRTMRQTMRNLLAAGLFHLVEQQLSEICRDATFKNEGPTGKNLETITAWYKEHFELDLETLSNWKLINEMRLVTNSVKHAEGKSVEKLRGIRPELFLMPDYQIFEDDDPAELIQEASRRRVYQPLAGEDLYVSEELLHIYCKAAENFFLEIAAYFASHPDDYYPKQPM